MAIKNCDFGGRGTVVVCCAVFFVVWAVGSGLWSRQPSSGTVSQSSSSSQRNSAEYPVLPRTLEHKLAIIEAKTWVREDDPKVREFASLLDSIAAKYPMNSMAEISDLCFSANQQLNDLGVQSSLSRTTGALDRFVPNQVHLGIAAQGGHDVRDFKVVAALYLTQRLHQEGK